MRSVVFIACTLGVLLFSCNGQNTDMSRQKGGTPPLVSKKVIAPSEVIGKLDDIHLADPSKGIRPKIFLTGKEGKSYIFFIVTTTTIYGPDWKAIPLDKLTVGQQVRVNYITNKEGFQVAQSIKPVQY
ncbi:MAG: hypothetical protein ACLQDF_14795 [Desulfomonilia bacterium]